MNIRWTATIAFIVTLLTFQGGGYSEDERPCQPDVVVMFGNGILNSERSTDRSRRRLQKRMESHISGTGLESRISYKISHNPSAGYLLFFLDFSETFVQGAENNHIQFWRYLAGLDLMPDILQDKFKEISSWVDSSVVSINPSVQEHVTKYDTFLSA